jgi:hypothetical protein
LVFELRWPEYRHLAFVGAERHIPQRIVRNEVLFMSKANSQEARARAEASFKKKEERAREGAKAAAEYEANVIAVREKTARLRALRLATAAQKSS